MGDDDDSSAIGDDLLPRIDDLVTRREGKAITNRCFTDIRLDNVRRGEESAAQRVSRRADDNPRSCLFGHARQDTVHIPVDSGREAPREDDPRGSVEHSLVTTEEAGDFFRTDGRTGLIDHYRNVFATTLEHDHVGARFSVYPHEVRRHPFIAQIAHHDVTDMPTDEPHRHVLHSQVRQEDAHVDPLPARRCIAPSGSRQELILRLVCRLQLVDPIDLVDRWIGCDCNDHCAPCGTIESTRFPSSAAVVASSMDTVVNSPIFPSPSITTVR